MGSSGMVKLKKARYEALLMAEIVHFAHALDPLPITLQQICMHTDPATLRDFLIEELPIRFARRIQLIESLPGWESFSHMRLIHSLYADTFRRLRHAAQADADSFRGTLLSIKRKNADMLLHVVKGTRQMKQNQKEFDVALSDARIDSFLDAFLTARIGTDILTSQYLAITRTDGPSSVISMECDPVEVVRAAANDAMGICKHHYRFSPPVDVIDAGPIRFPFLPHYLSYILVELLKNSLRAVAERYTNRREARTHPVKVLVCGDDASVVIKVSDSGGGIPSDAMHKVWSYLYTTAKPVGEDDQGDTNSDQLSDDDETVPAMAGYGCGLPLSRTYARYVGGRLELNTMPDYGTDAYLYLNRVGNVREIVDWSPENPLHF